MEVFNNMKISIEPIPVGQKSVLVQMMELYNYDFTEFSNDDINEYGYFGYPYIDNYWTEEGRYPYFIRVDGKIAGFILVRSYCEYNNLELPHNIAEFFVLKKYRHKGVGKESAFMIFDEYHGEWEISQWDNNFPAQKFWKKVISEYANGQYKEFSSVKNKIVGFTFSNLQ